MLLLYKFSLFLFVYVTTVHCYIENSADFVSRTAFNLGISGGFAVNINEIPSFALILYANEPAWLCGASIINERFLVSAAHCLLDTSPDELIISVGSDDIKEGEYFEVEKAVIHPRYNNPRHNSDIAVIKLKMNLTFSDRVKPIKMANSNLIPKPGDMMESYGFGNTGKEILSTNLLSVKLPFVDHQTCTREYQNILEEEHIEMDSSMICAGGEEGRGTCLGDSGGPLIYKGQLIGITSWGASVCAYKNFPSVYSYVPSLRDFVDVVIKYNT